MGEGYIVLTIVTDTQTLVDHEVENVKRDNFLSHHL
ncbi:Protein of unknown function [Pyronema omphalodes CBS 100304]|uniref:Uncharacterized protein n=1 Tax=Pyronema omphalodes (strain CBS 100304) TaxID=1076935 RepID=U4KWS5_PYROM|nr:Protein of unknown function [Pyronema omphalodes CBS 100304]